MNSSLPEGYQIEKVNRDRDRPYQRTKSIRPLLIEYMQLTYQEVYPDREDFDNLQETVNSYFSSSTPVWLVKKTSDGIENPTVGCLWMGTTRDRAIVSRAAQIFLLFVDPEHRRRGIGKAMMQVAEDWAVARGDCQIGLQVFPNNQAALNLYRDRGYITQFFTMSKSLEEKQHDLDRSR